jgi:NAD(P)-dependent dehydrogenase (short-subunit alcohol dehydrogenase family)
MTIALERRFANFRSAHATAPTLETVGPADRMRRITAGAERLAAEVDGELVRTRTGCFVRLEGRGDVVPIDRQRLALLPGQPPATVPLVCLDTETTGLATAAGTLAFLVGLGWWEADRFRQVQLLLPDHADEPALLDELRAHIPPGAWLVTYNGRGFDWPLLVARYRMARAGPPVHAGHLDLLPLVRRLFRHRMSDARLQTVETELLGLRRHGDVAGWEIPARYLQFLRDGEPARLVEVVRHNDEDVRSLARLLAHLDSRLGDTAARRGAPSGDLAGLARSFAAHRRFHEALECLDTAISAGELPPRVPHDAGDGPHRDGDNQSAARRAERAEPHAVREELDTWWSPRRRPDFGGRFGREGTVSAWRTAEGRRLDATWTPARLVAERARLLRRVGRHAEAEIAWLEITELGGTLGALAWVEIAKLREHHRRDPEAALAATLAALHLIERRRFLGRPDARIERELGRRAVRLRRRIARPARAGRPERIDDDPFSIAGQVALVTGATGGIGSDLAAALARAGARVGVAGRDRARARQVADAIVAAGGEAASIDMDMTDRASIDGAVADLVRTYGRIDVLVNNAGLGTNHDAIDATEEEWDELFAVNVRGLFFASQSAARRMIDQGSGRIVNMASQAGLVGIRRHAAYSASKAAVIGLTRVLALEWAPLGLTVNAIAPTWVYTPGTAERLDDPEFLASVLERIPVGRVATTGDVAAAVIYLASPAAAMVTGTVLTVDGGWTAQ